MEPMNTTTPTPEDTQPITPVSAPTRPSLTAYLPPIWAILLMLMVSALLTGGVLFALTLVGVRSAPPSTPQVILLTAPPSQPDTFAGQPTPPSAPNLALPTAPAAFALVGPTLPPVFLSPTPDVISIGREVRVINVGSSGLNVRQFPGISNPLMFTAREGSTLQILDGPRSAQNDGFTWWQVRDPFTGETGWAVDVYMQVEPITSP